MTRTVVIGGGVAGLASAILLAREGHRVTLFERLPRLGGRVGVVERDGFRFDTGPSWYLMPRVFDHFFALAGSSTQEQLELRPLNPGFRVFPSPTTSEAVTVPRERDAIRELFEMREPGSGPAIDRYLNSAVETTRLAEAFFLYNPFTSARSLMKREIVGSLGRLAGLLLGRLDRFVNQRFSDPVLRQVLEYPAIFLGTHPTEAPAMYHLMSSLDLSDGVLYPMGGFTSVVAALERLACEAGVDVKTRAEVTGILCTRDRRGASVAGVSWRGAGGAHMTEADIVVSAADLHHTETRLLPPDLRSYPEPWWHHRVSGPGAVIVLLGVRGGLPELPHHSLFFTENWHEDAGVMTDELPNPVWDRPFYVCKPSATDPDVAPAGHENLFILVPVPADPGIGQGGRDRAGSPVVERVADAAIDQIASWASIPDLRSRIVVRQTIGPEDFAREYHSWRGGMLGPAHTLSQSAMFRAQNASKRVHNLFYAGATTAPGVGVPMCLISAELVLKRIRGDHSPGPIPVPHRSEATSP